MKFEDLPTFVRESTVLDTQDKMKLASLESLPSALEVDAFRMIPTIQELTNAFIGDESTRDTHLQERAKEYLSEGNIESAWKVILL